MPTLGVCNNLKNPSDIVSKGLSLSRADGWQWVGRMQVEGNVSAPFNSSGTQSPSPSGFVICQDLGVPYWTASEQQITEYIKDLIKGVLGARLGAQLRLLARSLSSSP